MLTLRMILYFFFAALSGTGIGVEFDSVSGLVSVHIDTILNVVAGSGGFTLTFIASRFAKARGGAT